MVNIGYHSALFRGRIVRSLYSRLLPVLAKRRIQQEKRLPVSVYSFSCQRDLPEQVASIRSFIKYAGVPDKFVVVSDGSYSSADAATLCHVHPCVSVTDWHGLLSPGLPLSVTKYAELHPLGKKLATCMSLPVDGPTIILDADILFYPGAVILADLLKKRGSQSWYLQDAAMALDDRMLQENDRQLIPVNSGFMLLHKPLNWATASQRLDAIHDCPKYFTEQTAVHLAMHDSNACALDANTFVVRLDDQVHFTNWYAHKDIALRHYVGPVRHKMWGRLPV